MCSFQAFPWECMEGMGWNWSYWCILDTFRTDYILLMVGWFSSFLSCLLSVSVPSWLDFWQLRGPRDIRSLDLLVHLYLVISEEIKKANFSAHENYPVTEWGYSWLLCSLTFLVDAVFNALLLFVHHAIGQSSPKIPSYSACVVASMYVIAGPRCQDTPWVSHDTHRYTQITTQRRAIQ